MNYIFLLPFAFGGNPACESGPRAAYNIIMDNFSPQKYSIFIIEQKINESPENYLLKVEDIFDKEVVDNSKCCVIGGNHLSILPVYKHIIKSNLLSNFLILDAHRDFYPQNDLSHSTFLKYISHDNNFLLVGCRDKNKYHSICYFCVAIHSPTRHFLSLANSYWMHLCHSQIPLNAMVLYLRPSIG